LQKKLLPQELLPQEPQFLLLAQQWMPRWQAKALFPRFRVLQMA
jgi:hypothetical protein